MTPDTYSELLYMQLVYKRNCEAFLKGLKNRSTKKSKLSDFIFR